MQMRWKRWAALQIVALLPPDITQAYEILELAETLVDQTHTSEPRRPTSARASSKRLAKSTVKPRKSLR